MRSTKGKTRSVRAQATPHYTTSARVTAALRSNSPVESRKADLPTQTLVSRSRGWHTDSMYYRSREGLGQ